MTFDEDNDNDNDNDNDIYTIIIIYIHYYISNYSIYVWILNNDVCVLCQRYDVDALYSVQCTAYNVHIVQYTVYSVHCTMYIMCT